MPDSSEVTQSPKAAQSSKAAQSQQTSQATSSTAASQAAAPEQAQKSSGNPILGFIGSVFTLIFRLGLLTGGAGLALVVGVAIAAIRPSETVTSEPPLLEIVMQQVDRFRQ